MSPTHEREPRRPPLHDDREPFLPLTLATLAAPLLWALHFAVVYLLEGFLCTPGARATSVAIPAILAFTLICGGACAWSLLAGDAWLRQASSQELESRVFMRAAQRVLAGLSLVAILWSGAGVVFLAPCSFAY